MGSVAYCTKILLCFKILREEVRDEERRESRRAQEKIDLRVFTAVYKDNILTYCPSTVVEDGWHWRGLSQALKAS